MLVAFAWCSDKDLHLPRAISEYTTCDTIFGVTKEQRNLFIFSGIDGHNKVFTTMRCFVPSKETKKYHWVLRTALRHIVKDTTLLFNQCTACDEELTIYQSLRAVMDTMPCLDKSRNRLEKYHLLK